MNSIGTPESSLCRALCFCIDFQTGGCVQTCSNVLLFSYVHEISYVLKATKCCYRRISRRSIIKTLLGSFNPNSRGTGTLHPEEHRCLTVLECKRIQVWVCLGDHGVMSTGLLKCSTRGTWEKVETICAAQGFPDGFYLAGRKTKGLKQHIASRYQQIGNAVSPHVAEALGEAWY